ncbi:MAG: BACON domain-containing carbohydrate-binding protein [Rikenellaceae bacterium]|nr:BACON domain-containing carbohydrate-binding protein [Rikenellaceae bacterium]
MSRICFSAVLGLILLMNAACSKQGSDNPPGGDESLSLSVSSLTSNSKGTKTTFSITATGNWTVSCTDSWCTVSPASGKGNATVNVDIAENPSTDTRSTKITVTSGSLKSEIGVTQSEKSTILLTGKSRSVDSQGGKISVELKSNITFDIIIPPDALWISHLGTKALTNNTVEFGIAENMSYTPRSAKVIFREKGGTLADTLTINQEEYYYVECMSSKIIAQKAGSTLDVQVIASVEIDYSIIEGASWISMTNFDATKSTFTFRIPTNSTDADRVGKVRFFKKDGGSLADTVVIKQTCFDGYYLCLNEGVRLEQSIPAVSRPSITRLKIEGELIDEDFLTIRTYFRHLELIDLSQTSLPGKAIPDVAFAGDETIYMALKKVVLPEGLESIGHSSFAGCILMTSINLPVSLKNIGYAAFVRCQGIMGSLILPASLESIGDYAFSQCGEIVGITFPKSLKSIGFGAFHSCYFSTVTALMDTPFQLGNCFSGYGIVLIVPKGKKDIYSSTSGWNNTQVFKKIVELGDSYDDFIRCDKKSLLCYNDVKTDSFKIESSSDWKVDSKPSWVTLSNNVGNAGSTNVSVTVSSLSGATFREGKIVLSLQSGAATVELVIYQYSLSYSDGSWTKLHSATRGAGIDLVFMGDGYTAADIVAGKYVTDINTAVSHYFDIEPYRSYREYFNIYMVYAFSQESGITYLNDKVNTKFNTKFLSETGTNMTTNSGLCNTYAQVVPLVDNTKTNVVLIANSNRYAGTCCMSASGSSVAICPLSPLDYPYDFRGIIQHEACGHGFGQLADEYINYTGEIPASEVANLRTVQGYGMYLNVDATNDRATVLWKHFFSDPVYSYVSTYEGGYYYSKGIWRAESGSLMINNIRYINAPSREIIVKRIKRMAGEQYTFTEFRAKDRNELSPATKAASLIVDPSKFLAPPIIMK